MYSIRFVKEAFKEFQKPDKAIQRIIKEKLDILSTNPELFNIKPLKGKYKGLYRLRVGDYRIIYQKRERELLILIIRIGHRREIY